MVNDILQLSIRINNSVGEIFLLQPFQKKTIFIPCYFEEDIVKVKDDDEVEWDLLEFQKFRALFNAKAGSMQELLNVIQSQHEF